MTATFDDLVAEAASAPMEGWDFSWLVGRATEERPSWGYQRLISRRLALASAGLDVDTGGGEVLAGVDSYPATMAATESWAPNVAAATRRLHPRGVVVVATSEDGPLPFTDEAFDLVVSRHPVRPRFDEIARLLVPGGSYLAQHVGPRSAFELVELFLGSQPDGGRRRDPDLEAAEARDAGLEVVEIRTERLAMEFYDVGAIVWFLRKVLWLVPAFSVETYRDRLRALHAQIEAEGVFIAHSTRTLIEARKP
ncbi:MAG: methyltransferase domain-containing protein [Acidimicrobiales bacterium]